MAAAATAAAAGFALGRHIFAVAVDGLVVRIVVRVALFAGNFLFYAERTMAAEEAKR